MHELVAIDLEPSPAFVAALEDIWNAGDAALPVDHRLPHTAKAELYAAAEPTVVLDERGRQRVSGRPVEPGDALVVATSGTTGTPKAAVLTHEAVAASATITSAALDVDARTDHWLCCLPVAHIGGLSVITRALLTGTGLTVLPAARTEAIDTAVESGATLVSLVVAALDRVDAHRFRRILLGGSAIPTERPANTVATYGMTETGSGVVYEGWALEGVELRAEDDQIFVRSPTALRCYRDGTDPKSADGWLPTGDGGSIDPDGRLQVSGRIGDVINTGGEKVWPAQVERALTTLGLDAAVVGRPDPEWGQVVTVVMEAAPSPTPSLDELRDRLRDSLAPYALPRSIEVVDALPRTALGKVIRTEL